MKWEIKRHYIPTGLNIRGYKEDNATYGRTFEPTWGDDFKNAWSEAEKLADEGWELVGISQEIQGNQEWWVPVPANKCYGVGCSWTGGYILVFKRPKP